MFHTLPNTIDGQLACMSIVISVLNILTHLAILLPFWRTTIYSKFNEFRTKLKLINGILNVLDSKYFFYVSITITITWIQVALIF